jgi:FKBP12-rapamycin complex-associated protein
MAEEVSCRPHISTLTQQLMWFRLEGCQRDVEVWQRVLQVRSLVLTPHEDMDTWIHFADLCRTSDRLNLAEKTLTSLVGSSYSALDPEVSFAGRKSLSQADFMLQSRARAPPPVIFAYFRLAWAKNQVDGNHDARVETLQYLRDFTVQLSQDIGLGPRDNRGNLVLPDDKIFGEYTKLLARCHVELGQWQAALRDDDHSVS